MSRIRLVFLAFLGVILLTGATARAGEEDERATKARGLYELGMQRFLLADYEGAITRWEEGFSTRPAPEFLYNIGQAYRRLHRPEQALPYYQRYLDLSPRAPERAEVDRIVATLTAEAQARASQAAATPPATPHDRPLTRKPWFWATIGGGVVLVAAVVVISVEVPRRHDPAQSLPAVSFALRF